MGFLLGAFGKLAAGRRVRDLQARMMRVQTKARRVTRQIEQVSKMLETQKKAELHSIQYMSTYAGSQVGASVAQQLGLGALYQKIGSGAGLGTGSELSSEERLQYAQFQEGVTQAKANQEMYFAQMKQQIEEKYESLNDMMLEPLKDEEDSLQTEKDSLETQVQIAQADYDACKKMESADAKNLAPNYTGQG